MRSKRCNCVLLAILVATVLLGGCATMKTKQIGGSDEIIVERSARTRPAWIINTYQEKNGKMYFSGGVERVRDYAFGLRQARAEAIRNLVESIQIRARAEFRKLCFRCSILCGRKPPC